MIGLVMDYVSTNDQNTHDEIVLDPGVESRPDAETIGFDLLMVASEIILGPIRGNGDQASIYASKGFDICLR